MIYKNKTENRIAFKIKTGYYLKLLTPETMKLLGSTKSKITKDENGEYVPYLEITEVVCMSLSCHVRVWEWIHTLQLPECQGTPCSKQARNLKVKWL